MMTNIFNQSANREKKKVVVVVEKATNENKGLSILKARSCGWTICYRITARGNVEGIHWKSLLNAAD